MRTPDGRGQLVLECTALERSKQLIEVGYQKIGGPHQLDVEARVEHIGRRHALVHEARLRPDDLGQVGEKRDYVVLDLALDRIDARDVEHRGLAFGPDGLRGFLGDHAERRHRVGGMCLDLEPDPVARLRIPDRGHLQPAVARDHCVTRPLRAPSRRRCVSPRCWPDRRPDCRPGTPPSPRPARWRPRAPRAAPSPA